MGEERRVRKREGGGGESEGGGGRERRMSEGGRVIERGGIERKRVITGQVLKKIQCNVICTPQAQLPSSIPLPLPSFLSPSSFPPLSHPHLSPSPPPHLLSLLPSPSPLSPPLPVSSSPLLVTYVLGRASWYARYGFENCPSGDLEALKSGSPCLQGRQNSFSYSMVRIVNCLSHQLIEYIALCMSFQRMFLCAEHFHLLDRSAFLHMFTL